MGINMNDIPSHTILYNNRYEFILSESCLTAVGYYDNINIPIKVLRNITNTYIHIP